MNRPVEKMQGWSLSKLPPKNHADVGAFAYRLFEEALRERNRLGMPERWLSNYKLFRGNHWSVGAALNFIRPGRNKLSLHLLQANIHRTVANITARAPIAEVVNSTGEEDTHGTALTENMRMWNAHEEAQESLSSSVLNQEVYGITIEKMIYNRRRRTPRSVVLDPYAFLGAPGYYKAINDMPYCMHFWAAPIDEIESVYETTDVEPSPDLAHLFGEGREDEILPSGTNSTSINAASNYVPTHHPKEGSQGRSGWGLVVELWIRDFSTKKVKQIVHEPVLDEVTGEQLVDLETGQPLFDEFEVTTDEPVYPGGIRVITFTNNGHKVLMDERNPNVNWALPLEHIEHTYLFNRLPFFKSNSYEDTTSIYGFAMAEQVGDINLAIDDLWSQITAYLRMAMFPPLIVPRDTGVELNKIRYVPRLILRPNSFNTANGIRWLQMPTPPSWLFTALSSLLSFFDRISQIEDADRGEQPGGVIAASAIQMLQERGAVLMRAKIRSVDYLVRERGRMAISFYQNFGDTIEMINVNGAYVEMRGQDLARFEYNYHVESGSTVARTEVQEQQMAVQLFQMGAIDRQAVLQAVKFKGWKQVIERMGEDQLDSALMILMQAGLDQQTAQLLKQNLMMPQGGPGNIGQPGAPAQPGIPKAMQGAA